MIRNYKLFMLLIAAITIVTRFVNLDKVPPHLSNDEISIAYDAYSISKTLRDEHNHFLPILFQSHGDYKPPLAIYITSPTVYFLGNTEFSARLPSAFLGSMTVFILGLLIYELTRNQSLAFISSGILAITPWHIYTSRMLLETNIALFFLTTGVYIFFLALNKNRNILFLFSFLFFALSMYSYHTELGLTPLIIGLLFLIYRKTLNKKRFYFMGILAFIILVTPLLLAHFNNRNNNTRGSTQILFTQGSLKDQFNMYSNNYFRKTQIVLSRIVATYSSYIEPDKIFFANPNLLPKTDPFRSGLILAPLLPVFAYGLFKIKKYFGKHATFIYLWLILSPVIPALTVGEQLVVRNLPFVVPAVTITSVGFYDFLVKYLQNRVIIWSYTFLITISFFYFAVIYYYHYPRELSVNFQYGYKQAADYIGNNYEEYNKIIIDPIFGEGYVYSGVPHLYIPYFTNLNPEHLLGRGMSGMCGNCFAKYEIRNIDWINEKLIDNSLYIVPDSNIPPENLEERLDLVYEIKYLNQKPAFAIYMIK